MTLFRDRNLANVHPDLIRLAEDVGSQRDVIVMQGARSVAEEQIAIASHHSRLKDPMNSLHVIDPVQRPLALAIDLAPAPLNWDDHEGFVQLADFVKVRAGALEIAISWAGDWPNPFDFDHYELTEGT